MFNIIEKQQKTLYVGSQGVTLKDGTGIDLSSNILEINKGTLIEILGFDFDINRVRIKCIQGIKSFIAEIDYNYLLNNCSFESKETTTPIEALQVNNYITKVLDRDSVQFLITQFLLFIVGIIVGKIL